MCNEEAILEHIKSLIQKYKAEDKGSSEWIAFIEEHFESLEMYEAGMTKECAKKILNAIDDNRFLIRVKFVRDITMHLKSLINTSLFKNQKGLVRNLFQEVQMLSLQRKQSQASG